MSGQQHRAADARALAALRQLIYRGSDADPDEADVVEAARALVDRFEDQRERIAELESRVERLEATSSGPELSKREKHEAIVNAAWNKAKGGQGGPAGSQLGYGEVMAATGVSRRYSYTLMETMAAAYPWASYDESGAKNVLRINLGDRDWADLVGAVHMNLSED